MNKTVKLSSQKAQKIVAFWCLMEPGIKPQERLLELTHFWDQRKQ